MQVLSFAFSLAWFNAGSNMLARIAMIAITTSNSISVKCFDLITILLYWG